MSAGYHFGLMDQMLVIYITWAFNVTNDMGGLLSKPLSKLSRVASVMLFFVNANSPHIYCSEYNLAIGVSSFSIYLNENDQKSYFRNTLKS